MELKAPLVDWAAIGSAYVNGQDSIREIARSHGLSDTAVRKRAKAAGWERMKMRLPEDAPGSGHFVYVIREAGSEVVCKIGVSADPRGRLLQLQCATWHRLVLAAAFLTADSNEAYYLERAVHQSLQGLHLTGEWFSVGQERAISEIVSCANAGGVVIKAAKVIDIPC